MFEIIFGLLIFVFLAVKIFGHEADSDDDTNFYHRTHNDNDDSGDSFDNNDNDSDFFGNDDNDGDDGGSDNSGDSDN